MTIGKVAFVLEAGAPDDDQRTLDLVFTASAVDATHPTWTWEPGLTPQFHPVDDLASVRLRPPDTYAHCSPPGSAPPERPTSATYGGQKLSTDSRPSDGRFWRGCGGRPAG